MPMKGTELRGIRGRMKLSQRQLAKEIGVHPNSLARMERGEMTISEPVAKLVRLLANQASLRRRKT
jgi:transcriptional regulator with XRE-family HTH domain